MKPLLGLALALSTLVCQNAGAGEVIAHPGVLLNSEEIRDVFLGERQFIGNLKLIPADNHGLLAECLSKVLQIDERKPVNSVPRTRRALLDRRGQKFIVFDLGLPDISGECCSRAFACAIPVSRSS